MQLLFKVGDIVKSTENNVFSWTVLAIGIDRIVLLPIETNGGSNTLEIKYWNILYKQPIFLSRFQQILQK